jgi:hypothetical protein
LAGFAVKATDDNSRKDLIEDYDALHRPDDAAKFHAELTSTEEKSGATTSK